MARTRLFQAGFESNAEESIRRGLELDRAVELATSSGDAASGASARVTTEAAFTSGYGLKFLASAGYHANEYQTPVLPGGAYALKYLPGAPSGPQRVSLGLYFWFFGGSTAFSVKRSSPYGDYYQVTYTDPTLVRLLVGATEVLRVRLDCPDRKWRIHYAGSQYQTFDSSQRENHWIHLGLDFALDSTNGHVHLWEDGYEFGAIDGVDTYGPADLATGLTELQIGTQAGELAKYYVDDLYLDTLDPADPVEAPQPLRFFYQQVQGPRASYHQWVPSHTDLPDLDEEGEELDTTHPAEHWELVDERPHDTTESASGTWVRATESGLRDSFYVAPYVPEPGHRLRAVIPTFIGRKAFGADNTNIKPLLVRMNTEVMPLPEIELLPWDSLTFYRMPSDPYGGVWTEEKINSDQIGAESTGDYS